jgi:hypothetical protein
LIRCVRGPGMVECTFKYILGGIPRRVIEPRGTVHMHVSKRPVCEHSYAQTFSPSPLLTLSCSPHSSSGLQHHTAGPAATTGCAAILSILGPPCLCATGPWPPHPMPLGLLLPLQTWPCSACWACHPSPALWCPVLYRRQERSCWPNGGWKGGP